jgi:hypothetical protein
MYLSICPCQKRALFQGFTVLRIKALFYATQIMKIKFFYIVYPVVIKNI